MTNTQLREELFREINPLLDNDSAIKKVLLFLRTFVSTQDVPLQGKTKHVKMSDLKIPVKLRSKRGCIKLTDEDMKDERIQYIVNK